MLFHLRPPLDAKAGQRVPIRDSAPPQTKASRAGFIRTSGGPLLHLQLRLEEREREEKEP
jgi:hypothetical protein